MNSQGCLSALLPTMISGPSERAGLTEVPVSGMPTRCTQVRATPMASPAAPGEPIRLVAPSTTNTKIKVNTTSTANAPPAPIPIIEWLPKPSAPRPTEPVK